MEFEITYAYYIPVEPDREVDFWKSYTYRLAPRYSTINGVQSEWEYDLYKETMLKLFQDNPNYRNVRIVGEYLHYESNERKKFKNINSLEELLDYLSTSQYTYNVYRNKDGVARIALDDCSI